MAGCFGDSMFDRSMENELFRHLDSEAEFDRFCEEVRDCIDIQTDEFQYWFDSDNTACNILMQNQDKQPKQVAKILLTEYQKLEK